MTPAVTTGGLVAALALIAGAAPARADEALTLSAGYTADTSATLAGGIDHRVRYLDNLDLEADADLSALIGWRGARAHVHVLNNLGARPNDGAGTLQGIDNIEVGGNALRLFEAWVEQDIGRGTLRAGLYDLNSEFYASDSAGLLIAPAFGIGSELAASGPNGPSIFPSTALGARINVPLGEGGGYVRAAAINARASTLGDDAGVDFGFREGVLAIAEFGAVHGPARLSAGGWVYSRKREDIFELDSLGHPQRHAAWGGYAAIEVTLIPGEQGRLDGFLRGGFSEGHTTPYAYGLQTGLLYAPALPGRPDSAVSLGFDLAGTNSDFRTATLAGGEAPARQEYALEVTYADKPARFLTIQPDLQLVFNRGGLADVPVAVVGILRVRFEFGGGE